MKTIKMFIAALALTVFACAPMGEEIITPSINQSSSVSIDPTTANATSKTFDPQTVVLNDGSQYTVSAVVTWYGSTTTWTYSVVASETAKDISHVNFFGFDNCFWDNIGISEGLALVKEPAATECFVEDQQVIKYTPANLSEERSLTFSWTFNSALAVNPSAGFLYVKAGSNQFGGCSSVSIPGPSCETLSIDGVVNQLVCDGTNSNEIAFEGVEVTATQGTNTLTATTDVNGGFSFPNIGGEWVVATAGTDSQLASAGPDNGSVSFLLDNRPNGSCAEIVGFAQIIECVNQSPVTVAYVSALTTCGHITTTTGPDGKFSIKNVPFGTHSVQIGSVVANVEVTDHLQYDAGTFTVDMTGPICGGDEVSNCSLSQGYWFAKPNAVWPVGGLTIGGKTYTRAEGVAIWNTSNSKGLLNVKAAFHQASAILLSGASVSPTATVWADVQIIENYLSTLNKLTPTNLPSNSRTGANANAGAAAGRIGQWIQANHCTEN